MASQFSLLYFSSSAAVVESERDNRSLIAALEFLSEDSYTFEFGSSTDHAPLNQYLDGLVEREAIDEVLLFSGGLDSLGGAVQEAVCDGRHVALVSHRSTPKVDRPQQDLVADLTSLCQGHPPLHVPVWLNKDKALSREATQRTRSFLYGSLGLAVARMFNLTRLRFYENGITSMNLPISEQLVGAKASRTTHPRVMSDFARLFSLLLDRDFHLENPFLCKTKAEIINGIVESGAGELIKHTVSCIHTLDLQSSIPTAGSAFNALAADSLH